MAYVEQNMASRQNGDRRDNDSITGLHIRDSFVNGASSTLGDAASGAQRLATDTLQMSGDLKSLIEFEKLVRNVTFMLEF